MKKTHIIFLCISMFSLSILGCRRDPVIEDDGTSIIDSCGLEVIDPSTEVMGYSILEKLPGIWNGPVFSPTPLGSFPEWIVDFRPISASQISAKNELDSVNDIFMSFFIVKEDCEFKMAFRNGGGFAGNTRTSYMLIDSVSEDATHSYYRFVDPAVGGDRVTTHVTFKDDSLIMHTLTNKYNLLTEPETHMIWQAEIKDTSSVQDAITQFSFPQKTMIKDFSGVFDGLPDAVYYNDINDPYPESEQPYLGISDVNITISNPSSPDPAKKVLIIISTEPLFPGMIFNPGQLDYRSRYVFVGADDPTGYSFNYMHPGSYYINALYDSNGDYNFSSGDYINGSFDQPFTLDAESTVSVNVNINFQIP